MYEIMRNANLMQKRVYGADGEVRVAPHTRTTQRLSRPPSIQKLGAENHMLQLNI